MSAYTVPWGSSYQVTYDTEVEGDAFVATFPGNHEVRGPAGTLIGFRNLVSQVLAAVDASKEGDVFGQYVWPPSGLFMSRTRVLRTDSPLAPYLDIDWSDPDRTWSAEMCWLDQHGTYYHSASVSAAVWRQLAVALDALWNCPGVEPREVASARRAT